MYTYLIIKNNVYALWIILRGKKWCNKSRGGVRGGREGALAPPDLPKLFYFIFMCSSKMWRFN